MDNIRLSIPDEGCEVLMQFVDRIEERKFMEKVAGDIRNGSDICVWIEGARGSGKSYFMKYAEESRELPLFYYSDHNRIYKCNESERENEYQFFVDIISKFQLKYPRKFNEFLTMYFQDIYDLSWVETLAYILPNIKFTEGAKDLINKPLEQIQSAKKEITNRLYNSGLKNCLAKLVIHMLVEVQKEKNIVFCIDDACWLDIHSIQTLKLLINSAKYEHANDIKISLIILTRPEAELNVGKENYHFLEGVLKDLYDDNIKYIRIKNFDFETTQEYISLMDKNYKSQITYNVFRVTKGNPQELFQTLKFNDYELKELVENKTTVANSNYISSELIMRLASENTYTLPIICTIALMHQKVHLHWLVKIIKGFCLRILDEEFNIVKYDKCIRNLQEQDVVGINIETIEVMHDSLKETAIEYIKDNGEYIDYMNCLTDIINSEFKENSELLKELLHLYSEYDPRKCLELFVGYYGKDMHFVDGGIIKLVAQGLVKDCSLYTEPNIIHFIVPIILNKCIQFSYYELGYTICSIIYNKQKDLPLETRYKYLICFAKILIDKGMLQENAEYNAVDIIEALISLPQLDAEQKIESYLVAMSAYEHLLDFENINKYDRLAKRLIENESVSAIYQSMYLRNQGLVVSHCSLEQQYLQAITFSSQIDTEYERKLMLGTCHNNLGLHYLYSANIEKATQNFESAQKYLSEIGYDIFRVLNNIAVCNMLIGNNEKAYEFLLQAKTLNTNCVFEKLCIQSNISIVEYKNGNFNVAKEIVSNVIDDYYKTERQTSDYLIYSSAMVNRAYFCYLENDYINASKLYKDSMFFNYRYNDDLQKKKRQEMLSLCMYHLDMIDIPMHSIDIEDKCQNIFNKMYAPIAFAYYII